MADEPETKTDDFDADAWLTQMLAESEPETEEVEDKVVKEQEQRKRDKALAKLARELDETKKEARKNRIESRLKEYRAGLKEGDVRADFMWVLEGADDEEKIEKAIETIEKLGAKARASIAGEEEAAEEASEAFTAPVQGAAGIKRDREKELWETIQSNNAMKRNDAEFELWMEDTELGKIFKKASGKR